MKTRLESSIKLAPIMWHEFEQAAERAAANRARRAMLTAIGYDGDQFHQQHVPPMAPRLDEQLRYFFFSNILPFIIWIIKACLLLLLIFVLSIATYGLIWSSIMSGLNVKSHPVFFDYSHNNNEQEVAVTMPTGIVDMRSIKSAPWMHACEMRGETNDIIPTASEHECINNNANIMSYYTAGEKASSDSILAPGQRYFFELTLTLPESEINKQLGVFMVNVDLRSTDRTLLASSKQSSMLPFESTIVSLFRKTMLILPLASGLISETRSITLLCFDHYIDTNNKKPMTIVEVSLRLPNPSAFPATLQSLQIQSADIRYGKEMKAIQALLRNWQYSCACCGVVVLFLVYVWIALFILNRRARIYRWNTQPYADFFSETTVHDDSAQNDNNSNSDSKNDRWMGVDIEILSEDDPDAWEPLVSSKENKSDEKNEKGDGHMRKEKHASADNLVSDDDNDNCEEEAEEEEKSKPTSTAFPLGKLANNETVIGHEPLFPTSKVNNGDTTTTEHKSGDSNEKGYGESNKTPDKGKTLSPQEKEERDMANMVMNGKFRLYCLLMFVKSVISMF